jgi:RNA polymerase sigma-B factor
VHRSALLDLARGDVSASTIDRPAETQPRAPARDDSAPVADYAELLPDLRRLVGMAADDPGRPALRQDVILALMPVVRNIAGRYSRSSGAPREELVQVGAVGLITAIDRWDAERSPDSVLGYVIPCVRGEILRHFRDRTWSLRVSRRLKDLSVAIGAAVGPLTQSLGRPPRPRELAEHLDTPVDDIIEALEAMESRNASSLDVPAADGTPMIDQAAELDANLDQIEYEQALRPLVAALPDRERVILQLRFFGNRTQSQIATQLGISQMHVSRLLTRTLRQLRTALLDDTAPAAL